MKILVTGHKGFIGKNLFNKLQSLHDVVGIDETNYSKEWIVNQLNDSNADVVFHIGACSDTLNIDVDYVMHNNYLSTKWIADWCIDNNRKIIYASSASVYGTDNSKPTNLYGWSKMLGEDYVVNRGGIALRYFNVYGPGEEHKGNMASIIYQNYTKESIKLFPGNPKRDFVYIDDIVDANIHALEMYDELKANWYDVGSGESNPFEAIFDYLKIPYTYHLPSAIPVGYQFNTLSNKNKWMTGWSSKNSLIEGITKYKKYLHEKS